MLFLYLTKQCSKYPFPEVLLLYLTKNYGNKTKRTFYLLNMTNVCNLKIMLIENTFFRMLIHLYIWPNTTVIKLIGPVKFDLYFLKIMLMKNTFSESNCFYISPKTSVIKVILLLVCQIWLICILKIMLMENTFFF